MPAERLLPCHLLLACLLLLPAAAPAHDGEVHADAAADAVPALATVAAASAIRASASSELFETVAVLANGRLLVYVDRYASNEPVTGAQVAISAAALNGVASEPEPGTYALPAPLLAPGEHTLTVSVEAGADADLLLLTLAVPAAASEAAPGRAAEGRIAGVLALAVVLAALGVVFWRKRRPAGVRA
jgi:hypothetical protein